MLKRGEKRLMAAAAAWVRERGWRGHRWWVRVASWISEGISVSAYMGVPSRQLQTFGYHMYGSDAAWRCCVLLWPLRAASVGLCSFLVDQLGGYFVVHPVSRTCSMGTWLFTPPRGLVRRRLDCSLRLTDLLYGDLVIRPPSHTCSTGFGRSPRLAVLLGLSYLIDNIVV